MALALLAPPASAGEPCASDGAQAPAGPGHASAGWGESCPEAGTRGRFVEATLVAGGARVELLWERWETPEGEETTISMSAPPRFLLWHDDAMGCSIAVNVAGTTHLPCAAGAPPAPPALP